MKEPIKRRAIKWLLKRLVFALDKEDDLMSYSFSGGERKDYTVLAERFYDDGYSIGTAWYPRHDVCVRERKSTVEEEDK